MTLPAWLDRAACRDSDPLLFEPHESPGRPSGRLPWETEQALALCAACPVTTACALWVQPHRHDYSGVAAGIYWRQGRPYRDDTKDRSHHP